MMAATNGVPARRPFYVVGYLGLQQRLAGIALSESAARERARDLLEDGYWPCMVLDHVDDTALPVRSR